MEAECDSRCGNTRTALNLIGHAEDILTTANERDSPEWLDWLSPAPPAALKGNTQMVAGRLTQARESLLAAPESMGLGEDKQRAVVYGDLAAVETACGNTELACEYAGKALGQLAINWYATGMDRARGPPRPRSPSA